VVLTLVDRVVDRRRLRIVTSERSDGDVHPIRTAPDLLRDRHVAITGAPWWMVDQVHGTASADIDRPALLDDPVVAGIADIQSTDALGAHVAMWAADCAVVVLMSGSGRLIAVHAGWRGLAAGVLDEAVRRADSTPIVAALGPTIHPCCYEFGEADRSKVAAGVGASVDAVSGRTKAGSSALDVPAAVSAGLRRHGIELDVLGPCTGCDERWFSHRVRRDTGRHATIGWMELAP
jgi:polyphenol oxidase